MGAAPAHLRAVEVNKRGPPPLDMSAGVCQWIFWGAGMLVLLGYPASCRLLLPRVEWPDLVDSEQCRPCCARAAHVRLTMVRVGRRPRQASR